MNYTHLLEQFQRELNLKNYSSRTLTNYTHNCLKFFQYFNKHPFKITEDELKGYILGLKSNGLAAKTLNLKIYSIKSFYNLVDKRKPTNIAMGLARQKEPKNIPTVLSKNEVVRILVSLPNLKHRALLTTTYTAGLRLEETRLLKITDINSDRMVILVNGKGSKQRLTPLCHETLGLLRDYYRSYRPKTWLFEGRDGKGPLCRRSLHEMIKHAAKKAGINKDISLHTLRHCFATHLLEAGTSLPSIQKVLGHKDLGTTLIYTHVADDTIAKIKSPLADMKLNQPSPKKGGHND
jgi:site-specific recombinase XerD